MTPARVSPAAAAEELLRRRKAAASLHEFVRQAWPQVEAGREFKDNWHIGAITEHLEAVARGEIRNLLINQPPRTTKSLIVAVFWSAWLWIDHPELQLMFASYSAPLSLRDSRRCRSLVKSAWYQRRWGVQSSKPRFILSDVSDTLARFDNDKAGYRVATSVDGTNTGEGGDVLVFDDLNNVRDSSDTALQSTLDWWTQVMPTRMNDFKTARRVCVQQRTDEKDVSGYILADRESRDWVKLILPMEFETKRICVTVPLPSTKGKPWRDPRTKEGELLDPGRVGPEELRRLKRELGSEYTIAGQLQQRPAPAGGGLLRRSWFKVWQQPEPPKCRFKLMSVDTSLSDLDTSAYNAATTWGIFDDDQNIPNVILLSMWRKRCDYHELRKRLINMSRNYLDDGDEHNPKYSEPNKPDLLLIEDKGFGRQMIRDLSRAGVMAHRFMPDKFGDKTSRVRIASPLLESGRVWVPGVPPDYKRLRAYADTFVEQCVVFPKSESRDLVDTMSQAFIRLIASGFVWVAGDPGPDEKPDGSEREAFY